MSTNETEFRSLYSALKGWYCKPLADYPEGLRTWIEHGLGLGRKPERIYAWWANKTPASRIAFAKQWDYQRDPATRERREEAENFCKAYDRLKREIAEWEQVATPTALDLAKRDEMLATLSSRFEAMTLKRREMLGDFGPDVGVDAKPENLADATQGADPRLIGRNEVIAKFQVKPDLDENEKFWDDKLSRPPEWLLPARGQRGRPGISSQWYPLVIAHCLLAGVHSKPFLSLRQLDAAIHKGFPEWLDAWKEQTEDKR